MFKEIGMNYYFLYNPVDKAEVKVKVVCLNVSVFFPSFNHLLAIIFKTFQLP